MPLSKAKKAEYYERLTNLFGTYSKMFIVNVDNVGSQQMNATRKSMRGVAEIVMGKNTLIKKVLADFLEANPGNYYGSLSEHVKKNIGFVFTNGDLAKVRDLILANKVPAPARVGAFSPVDVTIPAGPTGIDPGQTSFFQVLQIPTKIVKGSIEITSAVNLIKKGDKVGGSEAALLQKLNIRPFSYGLQIGKVFDQGAIFDVDVLDIDESILAKNFQFAVSQLAALSLELGYPTQVSLSHSIGNAFKALVAVTVNLENYSFPKAEPYKAFLADPSAFAVAETTTVVAPVVADAPAPVAAKKEEEVVDALDGGGLNMFGGPSEGGGDY